MKFAGIGSRKTPDQMISTIRELAAEAYSAGWTLRSGAAIGADAAWESAFPDSKEIFLPWRGYEEHQSSLYQPSETAFKIASELHPGWEYMGKFPRMLMARNVHQILGHDLDDPVKFVACWTPDGCETFNQYYAGRAGGTGLAIALASMLEIPIYNISNPGRVYMIKYHIHNGAPL